MFNRYQRSMTRLGFLGAMNRDVVVQQAAAPLLPGLGVDAVPLHETPVSDRIAQAGAEMLQVMGAATYLGGSAFNAARVAALLNADKALDLAYFGIAGTIGAEYPHREALNDWAVDTAGVTTSPLPPATCLAMVEQAGRTLLTATGANAGVVDWLRQEQPVLAASVARCDVIHITSFLDPEAPAAIAELLEQARLINPTLKVSLDPGMAWIAPGGEGLLRLLRQTHVLHLNSEEYALLCDASDAIGIGARLGPDWLIVARSHDGVTLHTQEQTEQCLPSQPLPQGFKVVDATGAGDTFCGAFLWSYCRDARQPLRAAGLGFTLARHKIGMNGPLALSDVVRQAIAAHDQSTRW